MTRQTGCSCLLEFKRYMCWHIEGLTRSGEIGCRFMGYTPDFLKASTRIDGRITSSQKIKEKFFFVMSVFGFCWEYLLTFLYHDCHGAEQTNIRRLDEVSSIFLAICKCRRHSSLLAQTCLGRYALQRYLLTEVVDGGWNAYQATITRLQCPYNPFQLESNSFLPRCPPDVCTELVYVSWEIVCKGESTAQLRWNRAVQLCALSSP